MFAPRPVVVACNGASLMITASSENLPIHPRNAVPLYTEPGYALQRTLSALAMQQEDLRRCALAGSDGTGVDIPSLHVLVRHVLNILCTRGNR